jgi:ABC-type transport system involved in multi-copper enzyme maturation permease subunit
MSLALACLAWRRVLSSPARLGLLALVVAQPIVASGLAAWPEYPAFHDVVLLTWIVGAGVVGQDFSSGVIQLVFARPITRARYVTCQWLAVGLAAAALATGAVVLSAVAARLAGSPRVAMDLAGRLTADNVIACFGIGAVLVMLSSFGSGLSGMALAVVLTAGSVTTVQLAREWPNPIVEAVAARLLALLLPRVDLAELVVDGRVSWHATTSYLSTVTICLVVAIAVLNRRDVSYASAR